MTNFYDNAYVERCQAALNSPLGKELGRIFSSIPYQELLDVILQERTRAFSPLGRFGYPLEHLLKGVAASYYLGIKSTAAIARRLEEDEGLALICGFDPDNTPHRKAFSRFIGKLRRYQHLLDECLNQITTELKEFLPGFGEVVAVDSTPVRSHSNPWKHPKSDPEAYKIVKEGSGEDKVWVFGYNLHIVVDASYELPIGKKLLAKTQTPKQMLLPLVREAREQQPWFKPRVVIADKGYDSHANFDGVVKEFDAEPIIPLKPQAGGILPEVKGTPAAPSGPCGLTLIYRGWDKERGLRYECPERAGKAACPMLLKCGLGELSGVWIRPIHDYRRFGYRIKRGTDEWKKLCRKRVAIEHVNSRLKETRRLEAHCFRGFDSVNTHTTLSVLVMQAVALAKAKAGHLDEIRVCVRQVG